MMADRPLTRKQAMTLVGLLSLDGIAIDGRTALSLEARGLVTVHRRGLNLCPTRYYCWLTPKGREAAWGEVVAYGLAE